MRDKIVVSCDLRSVSGRYYIRMRYTPQKGAKQISKSIPTGLESIPANKMEARQMMWNERKRFEDELNSKYVFGKQVQFTAWMRYWIEQLEHANKVEINTWEGYKRNVEKHILPYFECKNLELQNVEIRHLETFYTYLQSEKKLNPKTIKHIHICINKAYIDAIRKDMVRFNPAQYVELPKIEKYQCQTLTVEEWKKLSEIFKGDVIEVPVMITAYCGLRRSEVNALKWEDINFEKSILYIRRTRIVTKGNIVERQKCKTNSSMRKIIIPDVLLELLKEWKIKQDSYKNDFGNGYKHIIEGKKNSYICTWPDGTVFDPNYISHHFHHVMEKSGLPIIRFHDLRHTIATLLNEEGVSLQDIKDLLGHSSIATTSNIYVNFSTVSATEVSRKTEMLKKS